MRFEPSAPPGYRIVKLASGAHSVHSLAEAETFHPVIGPEAEAEALYVRQLKLVERARAERDAFVVWDVGLGAAANPLTFLRSLAGSACSVRILSFDHTPAPLRFALSNTEHLPYLRGFETELQELLHHGQVSFSRDSLKVTWSCHIADFPMLIRQPKARTLPKPHAVMFDAFSPARNPAMWTQPLFADLYHLLDPDRPCSLPTYSRSTMLRVTLLLAGFYVGVGHATGEKEETTIAANTPKLIAEPLPRTWLDRVRRSSSAEPMWEPVYRQAPLAPTTFEKLLAHPQFTKESEALRESAES